nr:hypothetical protein [Pseudomonas luteola]
MDTSQIFTHPTKHFQFRFTEECPSVAYLFTFDHRSLPIALYESHSMEEAIEEARMQYWQVWLNNPFIKDSVRWAASRIEAVDQKQMVEDTYKGADYVFEFGFMEKIR